MAIKASKIHEHTRTVTLRFLGDDVTVTYRLGALGEDLADIVRAADTERKRGNEDEARGIMARVIEHVVISWDVLDDNDERILPTAELIQAFQLPGPFLNAVFDAIQADAEPGKLRRA